MKRLLIVLLSVFALLLVACGDDDEKPKTDGQPAVEASVPDTGPGTEASTPDGPAAEASTPDSTPTE
jgi:uncharacterized protein YcfL